MTGVGDPIGRRGQAALVYDTAARSFRPGVRAAVSGTRTLLYAAEDTELVLRVTAEGRSGRVRLAGQVLEGSAPAAAAPVGLRGAAVRRDRITDEDGDFRFDELDAGRYHLNVETVRRRISVADLDLA
jgi:hypothetical protein